MGNFENLQANSENNEDKQYYIPMEVTAETIRDFGIHSENVVWAKIGNKSKKVIMVQASKEQYYEYMRPIWKESKRQQRQQPILSLDKLYEENKYELADKTDLETVITKKMMIEEVYKAVDKLEKIDQIIIKMYINNYSETQIGQTICMSQRGVNKRKKKAFLELKVKLSKFKVKQVVFTLAIWLR